MTERIKKLFSKDNLPYLLGNIGSTTAMYFFYAMISSVTTFSVFANAGGRFYSDELSPWLKNIIAYILALLILFSFADIFVLHDREYISDFLKNKKFHGCFHKRCLFALKSDKLWLSFVTLSVWTLICPLRNLAASFVVSLYSETHFASFNYLKVIANVPVIFTVLLFTHASVLGYTEEKYRNGKYENKLSVGKFIFQISYTCLGYLAVGAVIGVVSAMIISTVFIMGYFVYVLPLAVLIFMTLFFSVKYGRRLLWRRRFLKDIKSVCKDNGYIIRKIKRVYSSLWLCREESNLVIETDDAVYTCKILGIAHRSTPIYLDEEGNATYSRKLFYLANHIVTVPYSFNAEIAIGRTSVKVLLITPNSQRVYADNGIAKQKLELGDKMMDCRVYHMSGFVNALERKCILK